MKSFPKITLWGIYSVWYHHAKVYQKTWLVNFLPPMTEPLVYLLAFGYGVMPLIGKVVYANQNVNYLHFIAPGIIAVGVMSQAFFEGAYGTFARLNFQKTWQGLLTAPLSFAEVFFGDWLWVATRGIISGIITGIVASLCGLYSFGDLLISFPLICLGSLLFGSMGILSAGLVQNLDQINVPVFLIVIPMYNLCGTYFPREILPPFLQQISTLLPLTAFADLMRWPMGLPKLWLLELLWMLVCISVFAILAWKKIYPQLFR